MYIEALQIGNYIANEHGFPMFVTGLFGDGTVYLDFPGNEGDVWEEEAKDLKYIPLTKKLMLKLGFREDKTKGKAPKFLKELNEKEKKPAIISYSYSYHGPKESEDTMILLRDEKGNVVYALHQLQNLWFWSTLHRLPMPENLFV